MFFYSDVKEPYTGQGVSPFDMDPVKAYTNHFNNLLMLQFISSNTDDFRERAQCEKEMVLCNKKLEFWQRLVHTQGLMDKLQKEINLTKKNWQKQ